MFLNIQAKDPDKIALEDDYGTKVSYGQLTELCRDFISRKLPRAVSFILCENTCGAMSSLCACQSARMVPLVLSAAMDTQLLTDLRRMYAPAYVFLPKRMDGVISGKVIGKIYDYQILETGDAPYEIHEQLSLLMTTSGSTGSPKLVRYKYGNLEANAFSAAKAFGWQEDERGICDLPIQYTMGMNVINSHLAVGATAVLTKENLMSPRFWNIMGEGRITNFCGVPFSYEILFKLGFPDMDLPYLRTLCQGGGKLTDKRFMQLAEYAQKNKKRFCPSFGTTETSARMAMLPAELAMEKTGSIGMAIPGGELFLVDGEGNEIAETEAEGELGYRGTNVTMGYGSCREDLLKGDEWQGEYRTGDIARRDRDGCYYIVGRTGRFLKLYGLRVSLDRCELLIQTEFEIQCACAGTDDKMEIYITDEAYKAQIIPFISRKTNLQPASFRVHVIPEIPKNENGKIRYAALKDHDQ